MHLVSRTGSNAASTPTSHLFQLTTVKHSYISIRNLFGPLSHSFSCPCLWPAPWLWYFLFLCLMPSCICPCPLICTFYLLHFTIFKFTTPLDRTFLHVPSLSFDTQEKWFLLSFLSLSFPSPTFFHPSCCLCISLLAPCHTSYLPLSFWKFLSLQIETVSLTCVTWYWHPYWF